MTTYATATSYSRLNALGIITNAQQDAAVRHPQRNEIGGTASPAGCLAWMVEQRIVSHMELIALTGEDDEDMNDADWEELSDIYEEALSACDAFSSRMNAQLFEQLAADGLISMRQQKKASQYNSFVLQTPAQALAHVVLANAMSLADFDALTMRVRTEQGSPENKQRLRLLENAAIEIERLRRLYPSASTARRPRLHAVLRLLLIFFVLACSYLLYHVFVSVPACDAPIVTKTIGASLRRVVRGEIPAGQVFNPTLTHVRQVGHAWARRQRGCTADVVAGDDSIPYSYIVGPLPSKRNKTGVAGANREIVEARFSNIGIDGDFGNKAEPIGRENLEAAFRAGVAQNREGRAAFLPKSAIDQVMDLFSPVNQDRMREIADIEPIGACRALQAETRYICRVLIEHNDPIRTMMGQLPRIIDAEFTFERNAAGKEWRMSDDFAFSFDRAVAEPRRKKDQPK
ncbi:MULTISPECIES: hypothetical protein [unclassified Massilia]|uniref:hypothetical protein n=1 Tax=unclassified Massilia TaxID=2609279 RepID=UPI00177CF93F|nr:MULTISPECIES: hypothetical protein [unclassified Massilia]MBD8530468.1 hypothetical protein [Massilia sp. CFBP 13647]MBD8674234.1 hypothetical protein [Massilia sp. CFBP 13721]